ncbi:MAG: YceI family protein [Acetobacteraceae bacterium]
MINGCLRFGRRSALVSGLAWLAMPRAARAAALYRIDQRFGTIGFAVRALGLFAIEGRFQAFSGELLLDIARPEQSRIDVVVDTGTVHLPLAEQRDLLRSPPYLDAANHPTARFVSETISVRSATQFLVTGPLTLRGATNPVTLEARLTDRWRDGSRHVEIADFVVGGTLSRSAFGMVADRILLSDRVRLDIRIRLEVAADAR